MVSLGRNLALRNQNPSQTELDSLLKHYQNGQYRDAEKLGRSITRQFPHHQLSWKVLGAALNQAGKVQESLIPNQKAVDLDPKDAEAQIILGSTLQELRRLEDAEATYRKAIALKPDFAAAHYCLGTTQQALGRLGDAEGSYRNSIAHNPNFPEAHVNLGITLRNLGRSEEAVACFKKAIALNPDLAEAHFNLGISLQELGRLEETEASYREAIALKPEYAEAHCNLGHALKALCRLEDAISSYKKTVSLRPDYAEALLSLSATAGSIQEAQRWIDACLAVDKNHEGASLAGAALKFYQGDKSDFNTLLKSDAARHPLMRSFAWIFSLPKLPSLYFHKWAFFDAIAEQSVRSRPFYEFGVWRGASFKYLIRTFKKGYGFDTFTGLPEDWHVGNGKYEKAGAYSSNGNIPEIEGGEFIAGTFEDSLPIFFSKPRPPASVINFDADLYSSTLCALNYSKPAMDKHTVLIFDELIGHEFWEQHEFKALNDFVTKNNFTYEVIAISFFTKQVAVKLNGI
jgi:tetratricopeptide (TPR) repeat protein